MGNKKPTAKPASKKFNFSKSIDKVSVSILAPEVREDGSIDKTEVVHHFRIKSLFDAMEAYRSNLSVYQKDGRIHADEGGACFALWLETIDKVENYDLEGIGDWKEFFKTNPTAREHAVQAANLLAERLGLLQGRVSVPLGESDS